ncbi:hypothetical protein R3P38DRAFT_2758512 [Favolaschia claudopus]|uniref:Uncharacterized protein n=1 Tax=Favolaschia claudopus TaxID=2862362 RepID=A0AAW0EF57_9AGAR
MFDFFGSSPHDHFRRLSPTVQLLATISTSIDTALLIGLNGIRTYCRGLQCQPFSAALNTVIVVVRTSVEFEALLTDPRPLRFGWTPYLDIANIALGVLFKERLNAELNLSSIFVWGWLWEFGLRQDGETLFIMPSSFSILRGTSLYTRASVQSPTSYVVVGGTGIIRFEVRPPPSEDSLYAFKFDRSIASAQSPRWVDMICGCGGMNGYAVRVHGMLYYVLKSFRKLNVAQVDKRGFNLFNAMQMNPKCIREGLAICTIARPANKGLSIAPSDQEVDKILSGDLRARQGGLWTAQRSIEASGRKAVLCNREWRRLADSLPNAQELSARWLGISYVVASTESEWECGRIGAGFGLEFKDLGNFRSRARDGEDKVDRPKSAPTLRAHKVAKKQVRVKKTSEVQ